MGMAASQARWLALTARKTNVEYEGQQVNQARTALAMKSANTFNELLALEVPTAPSTQDFTKVEYTYKDGSLTETIDSMSVLENDPDYNYMVKHYHYSDIYTGIRNNLINPQVMMGSNGVKRFEKATVTQDGDGNYTVNGAAATKFEYVAGSDSANAYDILITNYPELGQLTEALMTYENDGKICFATSSELGKAVTSGNLSSYHVEDDIPKYVGNAILQSYDPTNTTDKAAYDQICRDQADSDFAKTDTTNIYKWVYQGETRYACAEDLKKSFDSAASPAMPTENQNKLTYFIAKDLNTRVEREERAIIDINQEGRVESIKYEDSTATYPVITNTKTDNQAYEDAMNQYHYDMEVYEKRIADINAKTEKIQEQDRTLELRLRQLDTAQEALQTEMEAVQNVIQKNIESTFKTFES
jgi:chaperonin cofactor prefoldin